MEDLYKTIKYFCDSKSISVGKMCDTIGISKGILTDLKMGRKKTVSLATAQKIAAFFDIAVEELLEGGQKKETLPLNRGSATKEDIKFALFGGADNITDEMYEEVKRFALFVKERNHENK